MAAATGDQQVTLTLTAGGAITDQDTASEGAGNENLVGGAINLTADSIGEADPSVTDPTAIEAAAIDTDATILNVTTTGGGIFIDETNAVGLGRLVAGTAGNRKDITLTTGGAITDQNTTAEGVGNEDLVGGAITLQAGSGIGMPGDADIDTAVTSIDAQTTSGGIFIDETNNLALGRVDAGAGDITVKAGGTITDNTAAEGAGNENLAGGAVTLRSASGIGVMGEATDIDIVADNIDAEITGSTGDVSIAKTGTVELGSTTRVAAGTEDGSIQVTAGDAMTVVQDISTAGSGEIILTSADGNLQINDGVTVQASGSAKLTAAGNVALGRIEAGTDADRKDITITAGSAITDNNSAVKADGREEENLVGGDISLTAATGIGEPGGDADIDTKVVSIDAQTTGGGIFIDEADGVTLGTVTTGNGGGDIGITAGGAMTLAQAVTTAGSGKIDLTTTVGNLQVNAEVGAGGGLSLDAAGRLLIAAAVSGSQVDLMGGAGIEHTADGDVTSGGTLTATTQAGDIGMADGTVYSAGGDVNLTAANDVALGRIETGIDNTIVVTATNGAISDNTAGEGAGNENLVCCNIILTAASGIGATGEAADIDVTAGKIITATGSGGVYLAEIDTGQCGEPTDSGSTEVNTTVPDTPAPDPTGPETVDSDTTAPDTTGPDIASPDGTGPDIPVSEPPRSGDIPSDTIALQVLLFQETSNSRLQLTPGVFDSLADAYAIPDYEADGELYVVHLNGANESIWEQSGGCDDEEESAAEEE